MSTSFPIYTIAKELNIDSNRVLLACETLGIEAKGAAKKLNKKEFEKVKLFFETGKNASLEIIDLNKKDTKTNLKSKKIKNDTKIVYFGNRLIRKS